VTGIRRILASLPREKGISRVVPMFQKGALRNAIDEIPSAQDA
jgi:hypothetical protein